MKRLLLAYLLALSVTAAVGQPIVRSVGFGADLAKGTSTNVTVTTASQTVTLTGPSTNITINNTDASNTVYFQPFGGTASAANFPIAPGQAFSWSTQPPLTTFKLYASGAGTVVGVLAH